MRLFMDVVIGLVLLSVLAGVVWLHQTEKKDREMKLLAKEEVRRLYKEVALQASLSETSNNNRGYPTSIDPEWFEDDLPDNPLLDNSHPWLEVAGPDQQQLLHPTQRIATSKHIAKFWYNPYLGLIRARVPSELSDKEALELYNFVNDSALPDLIADATLMGN